MAVCWSFPEVLFSRGRVYYAKKGLLSVVLLVVVVIVGGFVCGCGGWLRGGVCCYGVGFWCGWSGCCGLYVGVCFWVVGVFVLFLVVVFVV